MKNYIKFILLIVIVLLACENIFAGGGNRKGTGGAAYLLIPVGARDLAMGGSTVATTSGIEALFWNPAGIVFSKTSTNLMFSHMEYIADIGVEYGAVTAAFDPIGTFALSVKSLSVGDINITTTQHPDGTGETYRPQFLMLGLTYARLLSDRISVGFTTTIISDRIAEVKASGVAFNIGVIYNDLADFKGLSLGVAVKNIGPQMQYDGTGLNQLASVATQNRPPQYYKVEAAPFELPSTIEIGMGYKTELEEQHKLSVSTLFQNNNFSDDEYKVGAEYSYEDLFFLRGGWSFAPTVPENSVYIYGPTVGAGIHYNLGDVDACIDYTFGHTEYFTGNHVIALRLGF